MAVSNKNFDGKSRGGGSSSGTKRKSTISTSYSDNLLGGGVSNPQISMPQNLSYRDNLVNLQPVGGTGAGTGGVTNEGVVLGNQNVERMPQIKEKTDTSYSANLLNAAAQQPTTPITYGQQLAAASAQQEMPATGTPDTSGGTGTTGSTGSTGGSTAGSGEVDTYEEFLLKQEGFYKEQLDKLNAQIEQNKQNALQQAESERERAVIDARSSYEQNKATYGANAEQLAAMGLSGSGYSDYLNQQAYATQRAETQNANAQAEATKLAAEQQANSDKLNAELSYAENMQGNAEKLAQYQQQKAEEAKAEEEQKKQYYAALLTSANTGEYTSEQLASLGAQYGLDEVQISQLQAAADKYKSDQQSLSYTEALQMISDYGTDLDVSYLETLLNTGSISQKQYNQLMAQYQQQKSDEVKAEEEQKYQNYLTVLDAAKSGNYTSEEIAQIAQNYGFDEAMVESLTNAASTAQSDKKADSTTEYYAALLTSANSGDYTAEQLAELGKQYGLSNEQITSITDAANNYKTNTQKSNYSNLMIDIENRATNKTILDTALKNDNISQEQYNDLLSRYQTNTYDDYSSVINTDFSQADTSVIDNAYNRGEITNTQYNNLKTQYNKGVVSAITAASLFYSNGAALDSSTAKAIADKLIGTGWLTQDTKNKINDAYNQAYNSNDDEGGCYAKGTLITIADGTQKAVEDIKVGDSVLVFNHLTGELDVSPISYVFHDGEKEYEVLKLRFGDAADVEVLFEHGFFDVDSKEYVLINPENAKNFVGHRFYRVTAKNGAYDKEIVTLIDYEVYTSQTECYAVVAAGHINSFANGMLSVTDDIKGLYNIFALDEDMKYDAQKMEEDIQKYGLFSYEDWKDFVSEEEFVAFNGAFLKVSIGKGLVTQDEIVGYIEKFLKQ